MMYPMGKILNTISTNTDFICIYTATASASQNGVAVHKETIPMQGKPKYRHAYKSQCSPSQPPNPPSLPAQKTVGVEDDQQEESLKWLRDRRKWLRQGCPQVGLQGIKGAAATRSVK